MKEWYLHEMGRAMGAWCLSFCSPLKSAVAAVVSLVYAIFESTGQAIEGIPPPGNALTHALLLAIAADTLLGLVLAFKRKNVCWSGLMKGGVKIVAYAAIIIFGVSLDYIADAIMPTFTAPFFSIWVLAWLALRECMSCLDHYSQLGLPLPKGIREALERFKTRLEACPLPDEQVPGAEREDTDHDGS